MQKTHENNLLRWLVPMVLVVAVLWPAGSVRAEDHVRDGWFIGMGYGYGRGAITTSDGHDAAYRDGATPQIRFGHAVSQHFMAGMEYGGWMFEEGDVDLKYRYSLQTVTAALSWHPGPVNTYWGGFYSRAGVGLAWGRANRIRLEDQEQIDTVHITETGLGLAFQIGYEFRITHNAAAGLSLGYSHLEIDKDLFKEARYVPMAMTLNWYWD